MIPPKWGRHAQGLKAYAPTMMGKRFIWEESDEETFIR
jgi:hypothetical protein